MNIVKMEQIYKNLYKNEEGKYIFSIDEDTKYVMTQESYILIYILELLMKLTKETTIKE